MNYTLICFSILLQFTLFWASICAADNVPFHLPFPFKTFTDGPSKTLLKIMFNYSKKRFSILNQKFDIFPAENFKNVFLTHCKFVNENFGGVKALERAIGAQKNEKSHTKLANFLKNVKAKIAKKNDGKSNKTSPQISILFELKTTKLGELMKECVTDFSILRIFFETANFILQNAYMANFEERAERLADFWSQFSKNEHSKPPQIGISTFQTKESEIKILYANNFHTLNTKTGEVLLKLLMANISGRILQKNKLPTFENCDEIADELGKMKWLENAVMDESNGLNIKGIYEKILEEFDNRRHNQYSAERSFGMACSAEFFKLHSLNYLSQFVLRQIVQSALTSQANFMYKIFQTEMKHLYEELHIFLREHFGTVVGQIGISSREKGNDEIEDGETDGDGEDTTGESDEDSDGDEQQKQQQNQAVPAQAPRHRDQHERNDDGHGHGGRGKAEESAVGEEKPREQCQDELKHPKQIGEAALSEQQVEAVTEPTEAAAADKGGNGGGGGGKIGEFVQHGHNQQEGGDEGRVEDTSDEDEVYHDMDEDQFEEEEKEEEEEIADEKYQNPEN